MARLRGFLELRRVGVYATTVPDGQGHPAPTFLWAGKLGTPLERMHCENLSAWARKLEDWAAVGALGASGLHDFCAAWNVGESGSTPLRPFIRKSPWLFGSGKPGTPFLRMHCEYSTDLW